MLTRETLQEQVGAYEAQRIEANQALREMWRKQLEEGSKIFVAKFKRSAKVKLEKEARNGKTEFFVTESSKNDPDWSNKIRDLLLQYCERKNLTLEIRIRQPWSASGRKDSYYRLYIVWT